MNRLTITEAGKKLRNKEISAVDLARVCLAEIEKKNPELNAYVEVFDDVEEQARRSDERRALNVSKGEEISPLLGIPLAVKDNILIEGRRASAGSKILENYVATYDATVVKKLKAAGAVFLGRTNMDEFAMGSSTETSAWGPTRNPLDPTRVPGGSSGGSAAAVAAHMALGALASETCGSIRQPASHTGLVGYNCTYGATSRSGLIALASSLDRVGPLAKTVADAKIIFEAIRGQDPLDSTSIEKSKVKSQKSKVVGVPRAFTAGVAPDILALFEQTLEKLRARGYEVRDIELPLAPVSLAVYIILSRAECSSNLARFDGLHYGLSVDGKSLYDVYANTRAEGFGEEVRRRILVGTYVLSAGYADAYYRRAIAIREQVRRDFARVFEGGVDAIVTPMVAEPAFVLGGKQNPLAMYAEDLFAAPANLADIPALCVPMGKVERDGTNLPIGFNIMAPYGMDERAFEMGQDIEAL